MQEITLKSIKDALLSYQEQQDLDNNEKPDVVIVDTLEKQCIQIQNGKMNVLTGKEGFKIFAQQVPDFYLLKIEYNGVILNKNEKKELYKQLMNNQ